MKYFIYITTNKVNGKKYIGQHTGSLNDEYVGSGELLKRAIKKHGKENFVREILAIAEDKEALDVLEKYYIEKHNAIANSLFYNLTEGGTGGDTLKHLSAGQLAERSEKIKQYFQKMPQEEKLKLSNQRSRSVTAARKDPKVEARRIAKLKETCQAKSPDRIKEEYKTRSGGNAYCAKHVKTPLGEFDCAKHAAEAHVINLQTVLNRCRNNNFPDWSIVNE